MRHPETRLFSPVVSPRLLVVRWRRAIRGRAQNTSDLYLMIGLYHNIAMLHLAYRRRRRLDFVGPPPVSHPKVVAIRDEKLNERRQLAAAEDCARASNIVQATIFNLRAQLLESRADWAALRGTHPRIVSTRRPSISRSRSMDARDLRDASSSGRISPNHRAREN